jgi:predicted trehalose synthase
MNAFIEIIEKLVEAVSAQTWLEQTHFPFKSLVNPVGKFFDACLFETSAQGAVGFLWVAFEKTPDLYLLPFRLARYSEDADLITISPWSLRDASADAHFYESWRLAQKQKNPLLTSKQGTFFHKKSTGEPSFVAIGVWSDTKNTCVRIDFQVAYKIFRTVEKEHPQSIEVELLTYLGNQNIFSNFSKLISVFEFSSQNIKKSHTAIGIKYVQNNGTLFPYLVSLLYRARFPKHLQERRSQAAWKEVLGIVESLARILGDFHKAMTFAPRGSELAPEQTIGKLKENWLSTLTEKLYERKDKVLQIQKSYPNYSGVFYLLPDFIEQAIRQMQESDDLGLRIRNHGNVHLGQFLIGKEGLFLLDYESDDFDDPKYRRFKQPCLKDAASLILSLKFAWYFTEKKHYASLTEVTSASLSLADDVVKFSENFEGQSAPGPGLKEMECLFFKFYNHSLEENIGSSQLRPRDIETNHKLFRFCFLMRILKEISRDSHEGNPRPRIWLHILQDFVINSSEQKILL